MDTANNAAEFTTIKLSRDAILANRAKPPAMQEVNVPEWGGTVYVREMGGTERDSFEKEYQEKGHDGIRARIVAATCCDEEGHLLFSQADVKELGKFGFKVLDRIVEAAQAVNKLSANEVDDLEKKSEPTLGDSAC